jgi:hypothetical protein
MATKPIEKTDVTDDEIRHLGDEAWTAGDEKQEAICRRALVGVAQAWAECVRVIGEAKAQITK